ncbi:hypothetical protein [Pueribacillus sp. YX66]|uniref:hypothetical protein n=1 Tax=Pueribacillus sp. YX66 TaxID=3229242 RepID=UPI00358D2384
MDKQQYKVLLEMDGLDRNKFNLENLQFWSETLKFNFRASYKNDTYENLRPIFSLKQKVDHIE